MNKCHFMSNITGELCENIWGVFGAILWVFKHHFAVPTPLSEYIKYIFDWSYSKQGF